MTDSTTTDAIWLSIQSAAKRGLAAIEAEKRAREKPFGGQLDIEVADGIAFYPKLIVEHGFTEKTNAEKLQAYNEDVVKCDGDYRHSLSLKQFKSVLNHMKENVS